MEATLFQMPANLLNSLRDKRDDACYYFVIIAVVHFLVYYLNWKKLFMRAFEWTNAHYLHENMQIYSLFFIHYSTSCFIQKDRIQTRDPNWASLKGPDGLNCTIQNQTSGIRARYFSLGIWNSATALWLYLSRVSCKSFKEGFQNTAILPMA